MVVAGSGFPVPRLAACRPTTHARSTSSKLLPAAGGRFLHELLTCELFPQTRHVELVGVFERS